MPIIERMKRSLVCREVLHCDEAPVQVLKEGGRKPQSPICGCTAPQRIQSILLHSMTTSRPEVVKCSRFSGWIQRIPAYRRLLRL